MTATLLPAEELRVPERVIVSPVLGVFRPLSPETCTPEGEIVAEGQAIGTIERGGERIEVRSAFSGLLMGMMAADGERVREGQPVTWLRAA